MMLDALFREPDTLLFMSRVIAASLCGGNVRDCFMLCNYGSGSNGKSTLFKLIREMLGPAYYYDLAPDALQEKDEANRALQAVSLSCRFIFADDPTNRPVNGACIKSICDGTMVGKRLYRQGNFTIRLNAKLFLATNNAIRFDKVDGGVDRRVLYYRYKYKFLDHPDETNPLHK
jgi:phage/plasmid-associated DNA primase